MRVDTADLIMRYLKNIDADTAKDILQVTIMPLVCVVIEDLLNEGKIELC